MSPCRPELFSMVHWRGLEALPPSSSDRLFSNASRYSARSIAKELLARASLVHQGTRRPGQHPIVLLGTQRGEWLVTQDVEARDHADGGHTNGRPYNPHQRDG